MVFGCLDFLVSLSLSEKKAEIKIQEVERCVF